MLNNWSICIEGTLPSHAKVHPDIHPLPLGACRNLPPSPLSHSLPAMVWISHTHIAILAKERVLPWLLPSLQNKPIS